MKTLIVCDRDHSAFSLQGDGGITPYEAQMLNTTMGNITQQLHKKGVVFALCSGNDFDTISTSNSVYEWNVPFISSKCGTELYAHNQQGEYIKNENFADLMTQNFHSEGMLSEIMLRLSNVGITFIPHPNEKNGDGKVSGWMCLDGNFTPELIEEYLYQRIVADGSYDAKFQTSKIKDEISAFKSLGFNPEHVFNLDALSIHAGKGAALQKIIDIVNPETIIVMGDSMNDRELIDHEGVEILLPCNASAELKTYVRDKNLDADKLHLSLLPAGAALIDYLALEGLINLSEQKYDASIKFAMSYLNLI